jgi:glucose-6-phosphate isomerase
VSEPLEIRPTGTDHGPVIQDLVDAQVAAKLAAGDPTLWGAEAEAEAKVRLGWVDLPTTSRPLLAEIDALRAALKADGVDRIVLCGMGGSSLAPEVITRTAGVPLTVLDSTDPCVIRRALDGDLRRTAVVVSSKSGTTIETDSQRRAFAEAFEELGIDAATRFVVVTDPGSPLAELGESEGYRKVFLANPDVGGRYSALTAFGLVPSGLAGADVGELLDEAEAVRGRLAADTPDNPALVLAAGLAGDKSRNKVLLADAGSGIVGFPDWAEQLIAESTGKQGSGLLPVVVEDLSAPELREPADDLVLAVLGSAPDAAADGLPTVAVTGALGAQLLLWETATAVAGRLLGINPFDQPDVESAKQATRGLLDHRPGPQPPAFVDGAVEVRAPGDLLDGVSDLSGALQALVGQLGAHGYVAVMAYLDAERDAAARELRPALARRTGRPVTFGWAPRFLHSTGQYHKGGPAEGVYLQITCTEPVDVDIPERPFTFGQLIAAQAAGDAQVLHDHGRPVLRLHLSDPLPGVRQVLEAVS